MIPCSFISWTPIPLTSQSLHILLLPPQHASLKTKQTTKQTKKTPPRSSVCPTPLHPSGIVCCGVSHNIPYCTISPTHKVFIAISHWSGSRPLAPHHHWSSPKLLSHILLLPQSWRSCGSHSAGPVPSHTPAGHRCNRC